VKGGKHPVNKGNLKEKESVKIQRRLVVRDRKKKLDWGWGGGKQSIRGTEVKHKKTLSRRRGKLHKLFPTRGPKGELGKEKDLAK